MGGVCDSTGAIDVSMYNHYLDPTLVNSDPILINMDPI